MSAGSTLTPAAVTLSRLPASGSRLMLATRELLASLVPDQVMDGLAAVATYLSSARLTMMAGVVPSLSVRVRTIVLAS